MTHNRPHLLRETLRSWSIQNLDEVSIIVSDNSTNEDSALLVLREFPEFELRKRRPSVSSADHAAACHSEARAEWFMTFHDDDLVLPGKFATLKAAAARHPHAVAIAGNALCLRENRLTRELLNEELLFDRQLSSGYELVRGYMSPASSIQPLPGYLYNRQAVRKISTEPQARKYSDLIFLADLAQTGTIIWLAEPIIAYRIHSGSDSKSHDISAALLVLRRLQAKRILTHTSPLRDLYAHWSFLLHLRKLGLLNRKVLLTWHDLGWREKTMVKSVLLYFIIHPWPILKKLTRNLLHRRT